MLVQVMVAAGQVCAFHVGGGEEEAPDGDGAGLPRWEFFIGDEPHAAEAAADGSRQPIAQIADAEQYALSGETTSGNCCTSPHMFWFSPGTA